MILARKEIDLLEANIQGSIFGNSKEADNSAEYLRNFGYFVLDEYGLEISTEGWRNTILREVNNDQVIGFN